MARSARRICGSGSPPSLAPSRQLRRDRPEPPMRILLTSLVALTAATLTAQMQKPAPPPTAIVAGIVTAADTGQPLRKAQVKVISSAPERTLTGTTDSEGRFAIPVPAGEYTVSASKSPY